MLGIKKKQKVWVIVYVKIFCALNKLFEPLSNLIIYVLIFIALLRKWEF